MNRRAFCLALLAAGCGARDHKPPRRRRRHKPPAPAPVMIPRENGDALTAYVYRVRRCPLAFHGDQLAQATQNGLQMWSSLTMTRGREYLISRGSFCFLQDGSLVAVGVRDHQAGAVIHRIDPPGTLRSFDGPGRLDDARLLPAAGPGEVYAVTDAEAMVLAQVGDRVERVASHAFRYSSSAMLRSYSLGDGRLVVPGNGLLVLHRDGTSRAYPMPQRSLVQLAAATNDRCWYTLEPAGDEPIRILVLARVTTPTVEERRIDFGESHIIDLASCGAAAAVLLMSFDKTAATLEQALTYAVALVGEDGGVRWRSDVPHAYTISDERLLLLNTHGAVAMSSNRVVLRGIDDALLAWDVATGQRVGG